MPSLSKTYSGRSDEAPGNRPRSSRLTSGAGTPPAHGDAVMVYVLPGDLQAGACEPLAALLEACGAAVDQAGDTPVAAARVEDAPLAGEEGRQLGRRREAAAAEDPAEDVGLLVARLTEGQI